MKYYINDTSQYHLNEMETLGWELTVCNTLEPGNSPCRKILKRDDTFGNLLIGLLKKEMDLENIKNVLEIGGGYGFLMRDLVKKYSGLDPTMLDISPYLIEKQQETLAGNDIKFINKNFFDVDDKILKGFDFAILNENIGDFETICDIDLDSIGSEKKNLDQVQLKIENYFKKYELTRDGNRGININSGAIDALEKLCSSGIKYIYLSEHSCEASAPPNLAEKLQISPVDNPERITLKGHDEFTIMFSDLEKVAEFHGYKCIRGQYKDFIEIEFNDKINFILSSNTENDEHEIIRHFIYDTYKYEYLILIKNYSAAGAG